MDQPTISPDQEEQNLRILKLRLEAEKLEYESGPLQRRLESLKTAAAVAGVLTAVVAVAGIVIAMMQWRSSMREAEKNRVASQLSESLSRLTSEQQADRLVALASLVSFLDESDEVRKVQIVRAIVNLLAVEESKLVRSAATAALSEIDPSSLSARARTRIASAAVSANRIVARQIKGIRLIPSSTGEIVIEEPSINQFRVYRERPRESAPVASDLKWVKKECALALGQVIAQFARKGMTVQDMSALDLSGTDFGGLTFAPGTSFDRSNLASANFARATLNGCMFRDADLRNTKFDDALLRKADFSVSRSEFSWTKLLSDGYFVDFAAAPPSTSTSDYELQGPTFRGADLTAASFRGFVIFGLWFDRAQRLPGGPTFVESKLDEADFSDALVLTRGPEARDLTDVFASSVTVAAIRLRGDVTRFPDAKKEVLASREALNAGTRAFDRSTWCRAKLPGALRLILDTYKPFSDDRRTCS